jgi:hypothetical protein
MTGDSPEDESPQDAETLAAELGLGIDLSDEEREAAEEMVAHLRSQFGLDEEGAREDDEPEQVEDEDESEDEEPEPAPFVAASSPEPPVTPDVVRIDGREVPVAEARSLIDLRNYLNSNPDKAQEVREVLEGKKAATEPVKPPEWVDTDDPAQMAMWNELQRLEAQQKALLQNQQQQTQLQVKAQAQADFEAGLAHFRTGHPELNDDDITKLRTHAVSLDIIEGLAKTRTGPQAITKALDLAYWDHPEFQARARAVPTPGEAKQAKAAEKKSKLNALGGSSGSAPRREAKPDLSSDAGAKAAAAAWLKEQNIL